MKKNIRVILVIVTFILLTGCSKGITSKTKVPDNAGNAKPKVDMSKPKVDNSKGDVATAKIGDYYPFEKSLKYMYVGEGNEYATYSVFVDYLRGNRQQIRIDNGGSELVKVLENKDGELRLIFSKGEIYYREDFTSQINNKPEILLKEPLTKGNSWTLKDGSKRSITNVKVAIKTPLASYECIEVTTVRKDSTDKDYYAANIGLVKTLFTSNGDVSSSLSKMEKKVPFVQMVKFYYPNGNDSMNYITEKKLSFDTNDITRKIFEKKFKEVPNENVGRLISPNTTIKSLYLNKDNIVYVDFSKEFTQEMNAGSGYESQILQCITNTLGDYYMVKKVYITVEGKPYSSGHILKNKGEAFIVDYKNTK
ncbi:GerMN domain-containing protein [Clostridium algoriphilum]|uniref:GerMN domain-containing protein n=1 Tax=Clostridium algoriphilum TaxID=198347 RepID=UPI001CF4FD5B|nr:GerMN domain-containing protein [Clostridium algoriphilum]MCB2293610.1 GerMN domain-containing protein [Clostridium algoriphilum]